jgi:hypothetical protein
VPHNYRRTPPAPPAAQSSPSRYLPRCSHLLLGETAEFCDITDSHYTDTAIGPHKAHRRLVRREIRSFRTGQALGAQNGKALAVRGSTFPPHWASNQRSLWTGTLLAQAFGSESPDSLPQSVPLPDGDHGQLWIEFRLEASSLTIFKLDERSNRPRPSLICLAYVGDMVGEHLRRSTADSGTIVEKLDSQRTALMRLTTSEETVGSSPKHVRAHPEVSGRCLPKSVRQRRPVNPPVNGGRATRH